MLLSAGSIEQLPAIASEIISFAGNTRILLFYGDMGAGKTTLIKAMCEHLGVTDVVTSPTFSIVNEYAGAGQKIYHFDFYRLKNQAEALDLGYEEYFYSDAWCFIEWPEKIPDLLPENYVRVNIQVMPDGSRHITIDRN
ncbi:MAG: tRNA ((37)-N6)-threonylcarbamoyltransferase complex ATPase subunit type 1 TsaE [Mucilaginibacter sp.]|nr:tRNA ((37)-N6)-threonylcarbamoyltransferase complex ATPase subunit type 1 TsaE [Mucilaginibacter sp.]